MPVQVVPTNSLKDLAVTSPKLATSLTIASFQATTGLGVGVPAPASGFAIGSANEQILGITSGTPAILVQSSDGLGTLVGRLGSQVFYNTTYDGTNYTRLDTANPGGDLYLGSSGLTYQTSPAGTGNQPWTMRFSVDPTGVIRVGGQANEYIRNPPSSPTAVSVESSDGSVFCMGLGGAFLGSNAYYNAGWYRYNVSNYATMAYTQSAAAFQVSYVAAGANPIGAWTSLLALDTAGNLAIAGNLTVNGSTATLPADSVEGWVASTSTASAWSTTAVNSWQETQCQATGTIRGNRRLRISGTICFYHSAAVAGWYVGVMVDGVVQLSVSYVYANSAGQSIQCPFQWYVGAGAFTAGSHRFSICAYNTATGTLTYQAAASARIDVVEERA